MNAAPALAWPSAGSAGQVHAVKSVPQIIDDTVAEFFAISARMAGLAAARAFG